MTILIIPNVIRTQNLKPKKNKLKNKTKIVYIVITIVNPPNINYFKHIYIFT